MVEQREKSQNHLLDFPERTVKVARGMPLTNLAGNSESSNLKNLGFLILGGLDIPV